MEKGVFAKDGAGGGVDVIRIGVISDTHLSRPTDDFKTTIGRLFSEVDMIIHAGDMTSALVYDYLLNWDLRAVAGNMDDYDLRAMVPEKRVEEVSGRRIGIIHGRGSPFGLERIVLGEFSGVDVIVFGHSHIPLNAMSGQVHLCNPGSYRNSKTVGMLEVGDEITFRLIEIG